MNSLLILIRRVRAQRFALLVVASLPSSLLAAEIGVDCDAGDDLQAAIDEALDGDVLSINGTCRGNFIIDGNSAENLTLKGSGTATLDGDGNGPVLKVTPEPVFVSDPTVVLETLTITGGGGPFAGISNSGDLTLIDVVVAGNHAVGVIANSGILSFGKLTVIKSQVSGNTAMAQGVDFAVAFGGIESFGYLAIDDSKVEGNFASAETSDPEGFSEVVGGIRIVTFFDEFATITNSRIIGNRASGARLSTAGISALFPRLTLVNSRIEENEAIGPNLAVGGVELFTHFTFGSNKIITLHDCSISKNTANGNGFAGLGGLYLEDFMSDSQTTITDCKLDSNTGVGGLFGAGGIGNLRGDLAVRDSKITNNLGQGPTSAGGIGTIGGIVTVEDSGIRNNIPNDCVGVDCKD